MSCSPAHALSASSWSLPGLADRLASQVLVINGPLATRSGPFCFAAGRTMSTILADRSIHMTDKLIIFDTTLRDGEQSPGASMTKDEKLRIARQLERLKVDVIEAGFAASSNGDFEAVKAIAACHQGSHRVLAGARQRPRHRARRRGAEGRQVARASTLFIATSALHMEKKLRMTPEQVFEQARLSVRFARNLCGRRRVLARRRLPLRPRLPLPRARGGDRRRRDDDQHPRHRGLCDPRAVRQLHRDLRERIPNSDKAVWSVHCHNDLGMAVANSLAGVKIGGARQVECTINGLGERAGNCSLEEVVMAVNTRRTTSASSSASTRRRSCRLAAWSPDHRLRGAAEQGGGRRQRLRARLGHPPGRRAQGARHLRDHARRRRGLGGQQDRAGQAVRAQCVQAAPAGTGHRARVAKPKSTPRSPGSRNWPTARARSSTRTSLRW